MEIALHYNISTMAQYYSLNIEGDANDTMAKTFLSRGSRAMLIIRR